MKTFKEIANIIFITAVLSAAVAGQTTEFTYQGQLQSSSTPGNGSFDFEFVLFDAASGGVAVTPVLPRSGVTVTNGIFSVILDFGIAGFLGPARYLEIRVREAGGGAFTTLGPRQIVSSSPHSIRSITATTATNSLNLGGVAANQFVVTTDPRMTNDRPPTPGSSNYIQNGGTPQTAAFNISGVGTASTFNSLNHYLINGVRVVSNAGTANMFVGVNSGTVNTGSANSFFGAGSGFSNLAGESNSFFGALAGSLNTTGISNSFFGRSAGERNTTGGGNTFLGTYNGDRNTTGSSNTFVGFSAGRQNTTGSDNAFFGSGAGFVNTADDNSFFGSGAGHDNTSGANNSFFGRSAGGANTTGNSNSFFGSNAGEANVNGTNNSFFGFLAGSQTFGGSQGQGSLNSFFGDLAGQNNVIGTGNSFYGSSAGRNNASSFNAFFGYRAGVNHAFGEQNSFFGVGAGASQTQGQGNSFFGHEAGDANITGFGNTLVGSGANVGSGNLSFATAIGALAVVSNSNTVVLGRTADTVRVPGSFASVGTITTNANLAVIGASNLIGIVDLGTLGAAGSQSICRNASGQISTCSSSLRYKTNLNRYGFGLNLIKQLKPITFDWKDGGMHDLGLGAEDVAAIEPLLVTHNSKGEVEGVKYDRIGVVLVNAVKEQQQTIERQQKQIEALKALVCNSNRDAAFCKEMP
ncbi:MAG: tail fiber domain-containing protein [Pyrinomonadaceae bacterium]